MGYTKLTHGYRINDEIRQLCTDCNQDINYNISREALGNNKEEAKKVIKYLKEIGLLHYI
jgi:hypothetical protein